VEWWEGEVREGTTKRRRVLEDEGERDEVGGWTVKEAERSGGRGGVGGAKGERICN
jgi:hypothetical protein